MQKPSASPGGFCASWMPGRSTQHPQQDKEKQKDTTQQVIPVCDALVVLFFQPRAHALPKSPEHPLLAPSKRSLAQVSTSTQAICHVQSSAELSVVNSPASSPLLLLILSYLSYNRIYDEYAIMSIEQHFYNTPPRLLDQVYPPFSAAQGRFAPCSTSFRPSVRRLRVRRDTQTQKRGGAITQKGSCHVSHHCSVISSLPVGLPRRLGHPSRSKHLLPLPLSPLSRAGCRSPAVPQAGSQAPWLAVPRLGWHLATPPNQTNTTAQAQPLVNRRSNSAPWLLSLPPIVTLANTKYQPATARIYPPS